MTVSVGATEGNRFRHVLGHFPTGVVAVTAMSDGSPVGMSVGSFTSVSLEPPLVAFLPAKGSTSFPKIQAAGSFCINVLAGEQETVCRAFAVSGVDKFDGVSWHPAGSGAPIIDGSVAWIDCDIEQVMAAGDHYIVLGRVRDLAVVGDSSPLVFFRGGYGRLAPMSLSAPGESDLMGHLRIMDRARSEMESLAATCDLECLAVTVVRGELVTIGSAGKSFGHAPADRIGQRMPFVPPLGVVFVAWADSAAVDVWLDRLGPGVPADDVRRYREMVERVRQRGWSLALGGRAQIEFELALARLSIPTPTQQELQAVRDAARSVGPSSHEPAELVEGELYRVRNINAPVFNASGDVVLMLTLIGLPKLCTLQDIEYYRDRLLEATDRVSNALGGHRPEISSWHRHSHR